MAKILENMEIGHNVLHGQWDWMNDPVINSQTWDWDTASTSAAWKHSHNYVHHTYTNIRGKDKDLGYEIMRIDPHQPWHPVYLLQPFYNVLLMACSSGAWPSTTSTSRPIRAGEKSQKERARRAEGHRGKARAQILKDYIAWPLMSARRDGGRRLRRRRRRRSARWDRLRRRGPSAARSTRCRVAERAFKPQPWPRTPPPTWSATCGRTRSSSAATSPTRRTRSARRRPRTRRRGARYVRQLLGAANIEGGPFFHVMSGNLGYQVEHHLYPDMPSTRYGEIAPKVREICERYELPYNTGPLQAAGDGAPHDPAARLPGRQAAAEAGPVPRAEGAHVGRARDRPRGLIAP